MWRIARWVLVVLWLVAAGAAWWGAPRVTGNERALSDIAAHRVVAYDFGSRWRDESPDRWFAVPDLVSDASNPAIFAWRTSDGRAHWTDVSDVRGFQEQLRGMAYHSTNVLVLSTLINGIGLLFTLIFLAVLWAGPAPVTATRWYWWWLFALVPFGLGLLYWAFREVPWERPEIPAERLGGWRGLGLAFVTSVVISLVLLGLTWLFGNNAFPDLLTP
ncbi:hypothetical protein [Actinoplanes sp. L3-i22]|uniref:hypothetical protein n=1 Tax=Actinoplanes sp. L3-i22 TaxID=2836373 RepID=UPI001C749FF9|nr:hypothetical protein [Actinoplanes sp. L3-i22]BCY10870.1 hypothetical protein L3i22_059580 [Actinoplanes sp. L3-i22]